MQITRRRMINLITNTNGKIFRAKFVKKDKTVRNMNCRLGVKSYLKGGTLKFDPKEKGLMVVFDLQIKNYRMINLRTLRSVKVDGKVYTVAKGTRG